MPTLSEITDTHSRRISAITALRDDRLREAVETRDRALRALPANTKLYEAFEHELSTARQTQLLTDGKAEAARAGALQQAADAMTDALSDAHQARRDADVAAFEK